jgi:site-specific recombinase XerD
MAVLFMSTTKTKQEWSLASVALCDGYTDFTLSREAMNCTPSTLVFYEYTVGKFLKWIEQHGVISSEEVTACYIREYIIEVVSNGNKNRASLLQCGGYTQH